MNKIYTLIFTALILIIANLFWRGMVVSQNSWDYITVVGPDSNIRCAPYEITSEKVKGFPFAFYGNSEISPGCGFGTFFNKSTLLFNIISWILILSLIYIISSGHNKDKASSPIP